MEDHEPLTCSHILWRAASLRGRIREYPDGPLAYLGFRDTDGDLASVGCTEPSAFVAALRRAADEIEQRVCDLPPVTETGDEFVARIQNVNRGGAYRPSHP
jgi:hypothetical protein